VVGTGSAMRTSTTSSAPAALPAPPNPVTDELFAPIVARFEGRDGITLGTGFGSNPGLRIHGKIFAMLTGGRLVVKLPKARVDELVASGSAVRFEPGAGRVMREWASVTPDSAGDWADLADEALMFVGPATDPPR
jgi:hypothetical protein